MLRFDFTKKGPKATLTGEYVRYVDHLAAVKQNHQSEIPQLDFLLKEAARDRVADLAEALSAEGYTSDGIRSYFSNNNRAIPEPIFMRLVNYLSDIEKCGKVIGRREFI